MLLDVHDLGPPMPLKRTLELLADLPSADVLIQYNDRTPQFLYPKLEDRGYRYATVAESEIDRSVVDRESTADSSLSIDGSVSVNIIGDASFKRDGQGGFNRDGDGVWTCIWRAVDE